MITVALGLGSNKSYNSLSPVQILFSACKRLSAFVSDFSVSSIYKTAALYVTDQDDFYNMVLVGNYEGSPEMLLKQINEIEAEFGRNREKEFRNGPRPLDIDIELFGNIKVNLNNLIIPHERMLERAFVLKPLLEIFSKYADKFPYEEKFLLEQLSILKEQRIVPYISACDFLNEKF